MGLLFSGAFSRLLTLVHLCPWTTEWNHCSDTSPSNVKDFCQLWSFSLCWRSPAMCWAYTSTWSCVWLLTGSELGDVLAKAVQVGSRTFSPPPKWSDPTNFTEPGSSLGLAGPSHTSWRTPSFPWGRAQCQLPFKWWSPQSWGGDLATPSTFIAPVMKHARHSLRVEFVPSGHKPSERALLGLSLDLSTKKSLTEPTFINGVVLLSFCHTVGLWVCFVLFCFLQCWTLLVVGENMQ